MEKIVSDCELEIQRDLYTAQTSLGKLYTSGKYFCETLEDTVRPFGIKVKKHTALPAGLYKVNVTMSSRFKREMPSISTDGGYIVDLNGIQFKGARLHGGNDHTNTEGCPLVAYNRVGDDRIQGTAEKELTKWIEDKLAETGKEYLSLRIRNLEQAE
jgi:hypothetical protein